MTHILGLSFGYHDAAAVILKDGAIVAASTEERHSRRKHDPGFPAQSIELCLSAAGIGHDDVDHVAYYENPALKFDRILRTSLVPRRRDRIARLRDAVRRWAALANFEPNEVIGAYLGLRPNRIRYCRHHLSHAASAYFCSAFDRAAVITLDGVGEWETGAIYSGEGNTLRQLASMRFPDSLGLFYSVMTAFLGFEVNEGEYKVMGMAAFGVPRYADQIRRWISLSPNGLFRLDRDVFRFEQTDHAEFSPELLRVLGPPRAPESPFGITVSSTRDLSPSQHYADVASSVQAVTEQAVLHVATHALEATHHQALCLAGGVALNSAANGIVREKLGCPMFVQPAAGDAGGALGAAKWLHHSILGQTRREPLTTASLGARYSPQHIERALTKHYDAAAYITHNDDDSLCEAVADLIVGGKVIGWFQGRSEWGPRALGNRSILASPCEPTIQARVNEKIKFRELFRPFAPAVIAEAAAEYFEMTDVSAEPPLTSPYCFMLAVCKVRASMRVRIPAVTHVDGTARLQLVHASVNPSFYRLIQVFAARSGIPVLLNTSFNLRGEPIVETPEDAIKTFEFSGMDALVLERTIISKENPR